MGSAVPPPSRFGVPAAAAASAGVMLAFVLDATGGRWALPVDTWQRLVAGTGLPPEAEALAVLGWCALGGTTLALAARQLVRAASALGLAPFPAAAAALLVAFNAGGLRLAFLAPHVGGAALIALAWIARRLEAPARRRRRPGPPRRAGRLQMPLAAALAAGWLAIGAPGIAREAGRIAALSRAVPAPPAPVTGAPPPDPAAPRVPGWRIADALDIADGASERSHGYRLGGAAASAVLTLPDPVARRPLADAGRSTAGRESFRFTAQPGRPVHLVARIFAPEGGGVRVIWNGTPLPVVRVSADRDRFQTIVLGHDRGQLVGRDNRVVIERSGGTRLAAFAYWVLQPGR